MIMYPLGFKATVGSFIYFGGGVYAMHSLLFTIGATPAV